MMPSADFASLLKRSIGLDVASVGPAAITRAVDERLSVRGLTDPAVYWRLVNTSSTELQELIDAVVVTETWFFRDPEAFSLLRRIVQEEWRPAHPDGVLRVLSLPSSTGEEPYSVAMTLLDAGVPADRFRVDALDISLRALARAGRAVYRANSFRGRDLGFRERHFEPVSEGYLLSDAVRRQVNFERRNLFAAGGPSAGPKYDAVFCRNLLIYFDRDTQARAIDILRSLLAPGGVLFVAPSEAGLLLSHGFAPMNARMAFGFRAAGGMAPKPPATLVRRPSPPIPRKAGSNCRVPASAAPAGKRAPADPADAESELDTAIKAATALANGGHLAQAAARCDSYLRHREPSAEMFHLLGVVHEAMGDLSNAADCYRKALYLDPQHHEVLVHMALLMEQLGRHSDARLLRQRARRLEGANT